MGSKAWRATGRTPERRCLTASPIASTDYIAADRVGVEAMGIDPSWVGSLVYCYQAGLGQYDLDKIDIRGVKVADVKRTYKLSIDADREKQWMGPMEELPARLG